MAQSVRDALDGLRGLGTVEEIRKAARETSSPLPRPRVNSHIHLPPNFSAFEDVGQAVRLASEQDVRVVGVSNYYDFDVYGDFYGLARQHGIFPLFGLEIICLIDELVKAGIKVNDPGNPGKMYICGKGITRLAPFTPEAEKTIGIIRRNDTARMAKMIDRLAGVFADKGVATGLTEATVIEQVCRRHRCPKERVTLQERHVAKAFQEAFFAAVPAEQRVEKLAQIFGVAPKAGPDEAVKVQNEIRSHLMKAGKPGFVEETFINFEQAYRLILALGGIPCYPTLADGATPICAYEDPVEKLIRELKANQILCAEYIPIRNKPEVLTHYVTSMRRAGIVVLGGTEHNTLDLLPIEPTCLNGAPVPEEVKAIFWEGTCVAAAHQFLTLHGECGFVDDRGRGNPAYDGDEARIEAFRRIGEAVLRRSISNIQVNSGKRKEL